MFFLVFSFIGNSSHSHTVYMLMEEEHHFLAGCHWCLSNVISHHMFQVFSVHAHLTSVVSSALIQETTMASGSVGKPKMAASKGAKNKITRGQSAKKLENASDDGTVADDVDGASRYTWISIEHYKRIL